MITKEEWDKALIARHGSSVHATLSESTVAICGLGGLGSNIAIALARAGIGRLVLVDFDRVDITNLHRQQYRASQIGEYKATAMADILHEIAPYIETEVVIDKLSEANIGQILRSAKVICEAFDDASAKAMLANYVLEAMPDTCLIAASGMAGFGSANSIRTRRVMKNFYLCGDEVSDVESGVGLISSRVMICAAHQAHMAVRVLIGETDPDTDFQI